MSRAATPRTTPLDAALLVGIPALLVATFPLPLPVRRSLTLSSLDPRLLAVVASHFVHLRPPHLVANVGGHLLVVPTGYALAAAAGRRRECRVAALAGLVALSALNVALPRPRVGSGFSGVVMGVLGPVPVALFRYLDARLDGVPVEDGIRFGGR